MCYEKQSFIRLLVHIMGLQVFAESTWVLVVALVFQKRVKEGAK